MAITLLGTHATGTKLIGTALSINHTLSAGSNRIAYVILGCNSTSTGHTATYGGVSMSIVASVVGGNEAIYVFRLLEASLPADGVKTVTVDCSGSSQVAVDVFTIQDAKQAAIEASGTNTGYATFLQKAITTLTDGAWAFTAASSSSNTTFTHDAGQNEIADFQNTSWGTLTTSYEEIATAGSVTQGVTAGTISKILMVVWADAPAPASSSQPVWFM